MIHSGKWIFIRFNPDTNVSKTDIEEKLNMLIETIEECIDKIEREENEELVEIINCIVKHCIINCMTLFINKWILLLLKQKEMIDTHYIYL